MTLSCVTGNFEFFCDQPCSPEDDVLALAVRQGDRLRSNPRISELERWDPH